MTLPDNVHEIRPAPPPGQPPKEGKPILSEGGTSSTGVALVYLVVFAPIITTLAAIPLAFMYGWISWLDIGIAATFYVISVAGIGVGHHRYFTHGAFKAKRGLRIGLAVAGSMAIEGPIIRWVATHRRHHMFADLEGDPHSPWFKGPGFWGLMKGLNWSHWGWMFDPEQTNPERFAPDLLADKDIVKVDKAFGWLTLATVMLPPIIGGLVTMSWLGALTAAIWGTGVRILMVHHVTWSTNSIAHVFGERPFKHQDRSRSTNVWWLSVASFGESWHNLHHANPTYARHGVLRHQIDLNAWIIRGFERLGWAYKVKWPDRVKLQYEHDIRVAQDKLHELEEAYNQHLKATTGVTTLGPARAKVERRLIKVDGRLDKARKRVSALTDSYKEWAEKRGNKAA